MQHRMSTSSNQRRWQQKKCETVEQFSFQMCCLESGDGGGTFHNWRQGVPDSWCRDAECLGFEVDPCLPADRVGVAVEWSISEYKLVLSIALETENHWSDEYQVRSTTVWAMTHCRQSENVLLCYLFCW